MSREQVLEAAVSGKAQQFTDYVEFSAEDASRGVRDFGSNLREVIRAGTKVINVPDTTGYAIRRSSAL
jgi:2-isopropylmalate synthase